MAFQFSDEKIFILEYLCDFECDKKSLTKLEPSVNNEPFWQTLEKT